jgi:rRNA maturation endonuclease Nob1
MPVVDTNVVIHGRNDASLKNAFTVPEVFNELESDEARRKGSLLDLKVREPSEEKLEEVNNLSDSINSPTSDVDEKIVALASTLNETLLTDDKSMQNLALHLEISFQGYMEDGVEEKIEWCFRCSNCREKTTDQSRCPHCGSQAVERKVC